MYYALPPPPNYAAIFFLVDHNIGEIHKKKTPPTRYTVYMHSVNVLHIITYVYIQYMYVVTTI